MAVCSPPVVGPVYGVSASRNSEKIEGFVQRVLSNAHQHRAGAERRRETRHPFPFPIHLAPTDANGACETAEALVVLGKHISNNGLDFYSCEPVPYRRVVVRFPNSQGQDVYLLMDLTWCRFCGHGWYENGGRFLPGEVRG